MSYTIRHATEEGNSPPVLFRIWLLHQLTSFNADDGRSSLMSLRRVFILHPSPNLLRLSPLNEPSERFHRRPAKTSPEHADVPTILELIQELASYEKSLHEVVATTDSLRATLSFPSPSSPTGWTVGYAKTLLITPSPAEGTDETGKPVVAGMALYFHNYSTWTAAPGIYLEDLFVRPGFRGRGYGRALLGKLARQGLRMGCKRLDWSVLKWNTPSIEFYLSEAVGGKVMEEWQEIRVEGQRLERLASQGGN